MNVYKTATEKKMLAGQVSGAELRPTAMRETIEELTARVVLGDVSNEGIEAYGIGFVINRNGNETTLNNGYTITSVSLEAVGSIPVVEGPQRSKIRVPSSTMPVGNIDPNNFIWHGPTINFPIIDGQYPRIRCIARADNFPDVICTYAYKPDTGEWYVEEDRQE